MNKTLKPSQARVSFIDTSNIVIHTLIAASVCLIHEIGTLIATIRLYANLQTKIATNNPKEPRANTSQAQRNEFFTKLRHCISPARLHAPRSNFRRTKQNSQHKPSNRINSKYKKIPPEIVHILTFFAIAIQPTTPHATTEENNTKKITPHSLSIITKLANEGDPEAQLKMGDISRRGLGTQKNLNDAFLWYLKAATKGLAQAQYNTSVCYSRGDGTTPDRKQAFYWAMKAAEQGHLKALRNIGIMFKNGWGTKKDTKEAIKWLIIANSLGDAESATIIKSASNEVSPTDLESAKQKAATWNIQLFNKRIKNKARIKNGKENG